MPTTRPRHQITETPDVARALDVAARLWPHEPRSRLLVRLVQAGSESLENTQADDRQQRLDAIMTTAGTYADAFDESYLLDLRQDWPA